jgi:uncharacterized repeat protein (TIGR01451 family)
MSNILSAISGHFGKNLILGTFLPVVLFVTLSLIFVVPLFPSDWPLFKPIITLDTQGKIIAISFITIVLTGLLFNLNIPILRFYEGYPWMESWIGKWFIRRRQEQFLAASAQRLGMRILIREMKKNKKDEELISKLSAKRARVALRVNNEFPSKRSLIIPTRLGNVIRSFEEYPDRQYGIGAITLWPRLVAKIDKEYAVVVDDSRTSFDFMLNISVLSAATALLILVAGLFYFPPSSLFFSLNSTSKRLMIVFWLITILAFLLLSYVSYVGAIPRANSYGAKVKSAFDLYRTDLLKQLGYERVPKTLKEERSLWDAISLQMIYGDPPWGRDPLNEYKALSTFARSEAPFIDLEIARGVSRPEDDGTITVTIKIRNIDPKNRRGKKVVVADTLSDGLEYEWNSALVNNQGAHVVGTNPYHFKIGDMDSGAEMVLTYHAIQRKN